MASSIIPRVTHTKYSLTIKRLIIILEVSKLEIENLMLKKEVE